MCIQLIAIGGLVGGLCLTVDYHRERCEVWDEMWDIRQFLKCETPGETIFVVQLYIYIYWHSSNACNMSNITRLKSWHLYSLVMRWQNLISTSYSIKQAISVSVSVGEHVIDSLEECRLCTFVSNVLAMAPLRNNIWS